MGKKTSEKSLLYHTLFSIVCGADFGDLWKSGTSDRNTHPFLAHFRPFSLHRVELT
jgi:hypothetical protein